MPPKLIRDTYAIAIAEYLRRTAIILFVSSDYRHSVTVSLIGRDTTEQILLRQYERYYNNNVHIVYRTTKLNETTFIYRMSTMRKVLQWLDDRGYVMQELTDNPLPSKYKDNY